MHCCRPLTLDFDCVVDKWRRMYVTNGRLSRLYRFTVVRAVTEGPVTGLLAVAQPVLLGLCAVPPDGPQTDLKVFVAVSAVAEGLQIYHIVIHSNTL